MIREILQLMFPPKPSALATMRAQSETMQAAIYSALEHE